MSNHVLNSFNAVVANLEGGQVLDDLTTAVAEVIAAISNEVHTRGGKPKGSITLRLDFKQDSGVMEVNADIKTTVPKAVRSRTVLWATPDNMLTTMNPKQQEFAFRDVNAQAQPRDAV